MNEYQHFLQDKEADRSMQLDRQLFLICYDNTIKCDHASNPRITTRFSRTVYADVRDCILAEAV